MKYSSSFDSFPNTEASTWDISAVLLEEHLKKTGSPLLRLMEEKGDVAVMMEMDLLAESPDGLRPRNVALMMFCDHPDKFFPYTRVEITEFPGGRVNDPRNFLERSPSMDSVPHMIEHTLDCFRFAYLKETTGGLANEGRISNYPFAAFKEAVVNAFYHRDYWISEPVIIELEPGVLRVESQPGPDLSISDEDIRKGEKFSAKKTRNPWLGMFLKELGLVKGESSGIPSMQMEMQRNGSPAAVFFSDPIRRSFTVELPEHPDFDTHR